MTFMDFVQMWVVRIKTLVLLILMIPVMIGIWMREKYMDWAETRAETNYTLVFLLEGDEDSRAEVVKLCRGRWENNLLATEDDDTKYYRVDQNSSWPSRHPQPKLIQVIEHRYSDPNILPIYGVFKGEPFEKMRKWWAKHGYVNGRKGNSQMIQCGFAEGGLHLWYFAGHTRDDKPEITDIDHYERARRNRYYNQYKLLKQYAE